jgi:hypothetical protein
MNPAAIQQTGQTSENLTATSYPLQLKIGPYHYFMLQKNSHVRVLAKQMTFLHVLQSNNRNIEYRIGKFMKLSNYWISDQGLNLSDYRISDSEKTKKYYRLPTSA